MMIRVWVLKSLDRLFRGKVSLPHLKDEIRRLDVSQKDRELAHRLILTVLEHFFKIQFFLETTSSRPLFTWDRWVIQGARLWVAQVLFFERIPPYAALNETLEALKELGVSSKARGFLNAIGRRHTQTVQKWYKALSPSDDPSLYYNIPKWLWNRWVFRWGIEQTLQIVQGWHQTDKKVFLRTLTPQREFPSQWDLMPLDDTHQSFSISSSHLYDLLKSSWFQTHAFVQNLSSQLFSCLPVKSSDTFWDVCAAPGGKSLAILSGHPHLSSERFLWTDNHPHRLHLLRENLDRLNRFSPEQIQLLDPLMSEYPDHWAFDWVLLDAPCSGLGTIYKNPDWFLFKTEQSLAEYAEKQFRLLHAVAPAVKAGGRLVYSVCTTEPEETTEVIQRFLAQCPYFEPLSISWSLAGQRGQIPSEGWIQKPLYGWEGFYLTILQRRPTS